MIHMKVEDDNHEDYRWWWWSWRRPQRLTRRCQRLHQASSNLQTGRVSFTLRYFAKYFPGICQVLMVYFPNTSSNPYVLVLGIFQVLYRYCQVISGISAFPSYLPNMFQLQIFKYFQVFAKPFPGICLVLYHVFPSNFRYLLSTYRVFVKYFSGIC